MKKVLLLIGTAIGLFIVFMATGPSKDKQVPADTTSAIKVGAIAGSTAATPAPRMLSPKEKANSFSNRFISPWDGSCRRAIKEIKTMLNDPNSFEHIKTTCQYNDSTVLVTTYFRSRNQFGGMVTNACESFFSYDGTMQSFSFLKH